MAGQPLYEFATRVGIGFQNSATQLSGVTGTVFEEVALGPMNLGSRRARRSRGRTTRSERLGIEHLAEREPRRLSGGQGQLVVLASLLAMRPPHLVLDEPTAQLDPEGTRLVGEALRHLASTGTALLIAEHKTDLLDGLCTRVVVIDAGRIVADGPTDEVLADPRLADRGVEPPSRIRLARALAAPASIPRRPGMTRAVALEGVGFVYPDGTRALDGVDLDDPGRRARRDHRAERQRQVDAGPPAERPAATRPRAACRTTAKDIAGERVAHLAGAVGIVFQNPDRQIFAGKVRSEVEFGPRILGRRGGRVARAADAALEASGLTEPRVDEPVRPRLFAAEAAVARLDPGDGDAGRGARRADDGPGRAGRGPHPARSSPSVAASGRTVIAISHDMRFVAESFGRVVVMAAGRVALDGTPDEVFAKAAWPTLAATYLEPPLAATGSGPASVSAPRRPSNPS